MQVRGSAHAAHRSFGRIILTAVVLCLVPAGAAAQEWLRDRRASEGPGIMLSDSVVFHAGIAVEGGYDTNVFYAPSEVSPAGAGRLRITPQVGLATLPPQRIENPDGSTTTTNPSVDFRLQIAAPYNQYLSADSAVMDQSDVGIQTTLDLVVFPRRTWSFLLRDTYTRTIDPGNNSAPYNFNHDMNDAQIGVGWAPGGGTLELNLLAGFAFNLYETGGDVSLRGDYLSPRVDLVGRWRFFPNTALTFQTTFSPVLRDNGQDDWGMAVSSSYPLRTWIGMNGQWTPIIATQLRVGYGAGFYDLGEDFESVIGQAEIDFIIGGSGRLKLGFIRDFVDSYFSNFYVRNEGYVGWDHLFAGVFLIGTKVGVSYDQYAATYQEDGTVVSPRWVSHNQRNDVRLRGSLFAEYRLKDWLGFNATVSYEQNFTDFASGDSTVPDGRTSEEYWKLTALAGARVIY
ncbi:MAG: hypothetical protein HY907_04185 [Deltaproteobacteria bacterium]|nr:hypothetical protein [Deltaproteobacteria bacterium]